MNGNGNTGNGGIINDNNGTDNGVNDNNTTNHDDGIMNDDGILRKRQSTTRMETIANRKP